MYWKLFFDCLVSYQKGSSGDERILTVHPKGNKEDYKRLTISKRTIDGQLTAFQGYYRLQKVPPRLSGQRASERHLKKTNLLTKNASPKENKSSAHVERVLT